MSYPLFHPRSSAPAPMLLDRDTFRREFPHESAFLEFKQGMPDAQIARTAVAFSNTDGGVILCGVDDAGQPTGVNTDPEALSRLHRALGTVHDCGRYEVTAVHVGNRGVAVISVQPRTSGFAQTSDGQVVVRRDAMNVALMGAELAELVTRRALRRFESEPVGVAVTPEEGLLRALADAYSWTGDIQVRLVEHGFATLVGADVRLTVAGALFLCPEPPRELGKAQVEVFRYRDDHDANEDKRYTITGSLPRQVEETTQRVLDEIGADVVVLGLRRYELERLPLTVLREAVVNAVAHRVYEDHRRPVRIDIRPGGVRVVSPGPLPEPVTIENMREQNAARNVDVIAALRRFRLTEDAGRGVDLMQDEMARQLLDPPRFSTDGASVTVDLPLSSTVTPAERAWVADVEIQGKLRPYDRVLIVHAARGETLTNSTARELLSVDSTHARAALRRLCAANLLVQEGQRAGARYRLAPTIIPPPGLRRSRLDLRQVVLALAASGPVTNRLIRERVGLDRVDTLALLKELVGRGELVAVGERRGARYVLPA